MAIFRNFINIMTYGFVALFLLSFSAISTDQNEEAKGSEFDITKYYVSTSSSDSNSDSNFDITKYYVSDSELNPASSSNPSIMWGGAEKPKFDIEIQERLLYKEGKQVIFQVRNDQDPINNVDFITQELSVLARSLKQIHKRKGLDSESCVISMVRGCQSYNLFTGSDRFNWDNFKNYLMLSTAFSGVVGEVASQVFFDHLGYIPLKDYQKKVVTDDGRMYSSEQPLCNTQDTSNRGIDFIFVSKEEDKKIAQGELEKFSHIIINEAKFRGNKDSISASGFHTTKYYYQDDKPHDSWRNRQAHSFWNKYNFRKTKCVPKGLGNYDEQNIIRTVTLLNQDGNIKLYEVRDAEDDISCTSSDDTRKKYISENYPDFKKNISTIGYTLN